MPNPCPVLLINLAGSKDRLATAQAELSRSGLSFERIEAVDGRLRSAEQLAQLAPWDRAAFFKPLSPGEVGCYLSHVAAAERIVQAGWPCAVVLEDDFRLKEGFAEALAALAARPSLPHMVKFEGRLSGGEAVGMLDSGHWLMRYRRPPINAIAYLWTQEGARRFLEVARPLRRPVDVQFKHWWEGDLDIVSLAPPTVTHDLAHAGASTIGVRRTSSLATRLRQWRYRLAYAFESQWQLLRRYGFLAWLRVNLG